MTHLTYDDFVNVGKGVRSFTCATCNGFQYLKIPFFAHHSKMMAICEECRANAAPKSGYEGLDGRSKKPGLSEVVKSIWQAEYASFTSNYKEWIKANGANEEEVAGELQQHRLGLWREHYRKITGENWT